jgi:SAM-dependent methyltransferase
VLDLGCGAGAFTTALARHGCDVVGVDIAERALGRARQAAPGADLRLLEPDGSIPLEHGSVDLVWCSEVLEHVADVAHLLLEARRVLRPGGRAFVEVYNPWSLKRLANGVAGALGRGKPVYVRHDSVRQVRRLLPAGWSVKAVRGVRIFAPSKHAYTLPGLAKVVPRLERRACDGPLGRFGGYLVLEVGPVG